MHLLVTKCRAHLREDGQAQRVYLVSELTCAHKGLSLYHCQGRGQVTELSGDSTAKAFGLPAVFRHWEGGVHSLRVNGCANKNYME